MNHHFLDTIRSSDNNLVETIESAYRICFLEGSASTDNLQANSRITVYHGTNSTDIKTILERGIDATKTHSRSYNQGKERGFYVTDDLKTARKFGNWIIEFIAEGKYLYPTARWGIGADRKNEKVKEMTSTEYPNSFRPVEPLIRHMVGMSQQRLIKY